jgi:hypothetical protein
MDEDRSRSPDDSGLLWLEEKFIAGTID